MLNAPTEVGELLSDATEDLLNKAFRNAKGEMIDSHASRDVCG